MDVAAINQRQRCHDLDGSSCAHDRRGCMMIGADAMQGSRILRSSILDRPCEDGGTGPATPMTQAATVLKGWSFRHRRAVSASERRRIERATKRFAWESDGYEATSALGTAAAELMLEKACVAFGNSFHLTSSGWYFRASRDQHQRQSCEQSARVPTAFGGIRVRPEQIPTGAHWQYSWQSIMMTRVDATAALQRLRTWMARKIGRVA
eukprot:124923-Rhodomonas_salina.2